MDYVEIKRLDWVRLWIESSGVLMTLVQPMMILYVFYTPSWRLIKVGQVLPLVDDHFRLIKFLRSLQIMIYEYYHQYRLC